MTTMPPLSVRTDRPLLSASGVILQIRDLEVSLSFYTQTLGLPLGLRCSDYAEVDAPGLVIELHEGSPGASGMPAHPPMGELSIGFRVDDLREAVRYFEARGLSLQAGENERYRWVQFSDPDGTPLRLIERK
ncbi:VOC family protein [Pollutimonas bauzanensis]|uniref:Catechol 2,3-dioxygenase n=1 Tax=Pollutimonas bauzanensis TaxID=658167 RepID=A0A1M5W263_9BURK|nr:VOC family protein [Pollutimonas bauzanensis]SHH81679.1 Catechol 2,3-dioxygenase [Pollutimonas bauzanensis]